MGKMPPPEDPGVTAWRELLNLQARTFARLEADLAAAGQVPLGWYDVLVALAQTPGRRLRLHELADKAVLSRSGLTRLVDRLDDEGLLKRERCGADGRGYFAVLTERGLAAVRSAWPVYRRGIRRYFADHLAEAEIASLLRMMGKLRGASGTETA